MTEGLSDVLYFLLIEMGLIFPTTPEAVAFVEGLAEGEETPELPASLREPPDPDAPPRRREDSR